MRLFPAGVAIVASAAVLLALTACMPPSGAALVDRFAGDVARIDGVIRGDAAAGPIEVELEPALDQNETVRAIDDVIELLHSETYASWSAESLRVGTIDEHHAPHGTWIRWSGGVAESAASDLSIWFSLREVRDDSYQELAIYTTAAQSPILTVMPPSVGGEVDAAAIEAEYLAVWEQGARAGERLHVELRLRG